jgi:hypothetical protein
MWQVGRARYLGETQQLRIFRQPLFEDFMHSSGEGIFSNSMRMSLLYLYAYPPELVCSECSRSPMQSERARLTWRMYRDDDGTPHVLCAECAAEAAEGGE